MSVIFFLVLGSLLFSINAQICSEAQDNCSSSLSLCPVSSLNQTSECECYQNELNNCGGHCDSLAITAASLCTSAIITGALLTPPQSVFSNGSNGCSMCTSNIYGSNNWPSSCSKAMITYAKCFVQNVPLILGGPAANGNQPIAAACQCMTNFVSQLSNCGVPGFSPAVYQGYCAAYSFIGQLCSCGGTTLNPNPAELIAYVKSTLISDFQNWLNNNGGISGVLSATFDTTRTYICEDRLLLNIASGNADEASIQAAVSSYFSDNGKRFVVLLGNEDITTCPTTTTVKRGEEGEVQTSQYTVVALTAGSSALQGQVFLIFGLFLAILYS